MSDKLLCGQACDWHTHKHTYTNRQTHTHDGKHNIGRPNRTLGKNCKILWTHINNLITWWSQFLYLSFDLFITTECIRNIMLSVIFILLSLLIPATCYQLVKYTVNCVGRHTLVKVFYVSNLICTNWTADPIHWHIYTALGWDVLSIMTLIYFLIFHHTSSKVANILKLIIMHNIHNSFLHFYIYTAEQMTQLCLSEMSPHKLPAMLTFSFVYADGHLWYLSKKTNI